MKRGDAARAISSAVGDDTVVVCSLGSTSRAWASIGAPNPTHYASDPMGLAGSVALGLALAVRPRRVLFLAGDGDLTMNLQVLLAISGAPPCQLGVVVFANGRYETGGGHQLAGADVDLLAVAHGAGLRVLDRPTSPDELAAVASSLWDRAGVAFTVVDIDTEPAPYGGPGERSGVEERVLFQQRLRATAPQLSDLPGDA